MNAFAYVSLFGSHSSVFVGGVGLVGGVSGSFAGGVSGSFAGGAFGSFGFSSDGGGDDAGSFEVCSSVAFVAPVAFVGFCCCVGPIRSSSLAPVAQAPTVTLRVAKDVTRIVWRKVRHMARILATNDLMRRHLSARRLSRDL